MSEDDYEPRFTLDEIRRALHMDFYGQGSDDEDDPTAEHEKRQAEEMFVRLRPALFYAREDRDAFNRSTRKANAGVDQFCGFPVVRSEDVPPGTFVVVVAGAERTAPPVSGSSSEGGETDA